MPKIRQYAQRDARTDAEIRNTKRLAEEVGIPYTSFWRLLQEPEKMTLGQLQQLLKTIPLPAAAILAFVGYERKEVKSYE